ncbi:insulin-like growth factor-binding protein 3 [Salvelinus fontinalis]|uniref:insulin-like growth factor-binding protein 3 n=1 Tax=Salvelinus fontinalis TaxID=8038 RepID=UPI002485E017|nr:insulin-like growth factor-binding protein 3 [Salvelinus fontinalis]
MPGLCLFCLTAVLAAFTRFAETVGTVVRCEPCDTVALMQCKPLAKDCADSVREPGCGCCLTCALAEGQACGVYTGRCGSGLTCQHQPGETRPLQALLEGRGACSSVASKKLSTILLPTQKQENAGREQVVAGEEWRTNVTVMTTMAVGAVVVEGGGGKHQMTIEAKPPLHTKLDVIKKEQNKKSQSYKMESGSGGVKANIPRFSLEDKRETEYGPCRREMESILNSLKITNVLIPRGVRIPNCGKKGFYKKKQCRPSKGRKRGYCWCVDKYGQPLPSYDGKERGESQCNNLENK